MKFNLSRETDETLIDQIATKMIERIHIGMLSGGQQLPSMRAFARTNNVSIVTVSKAYHALAKKGYISLVHGKGAFVRQVKDAPARTAAPYDWQHDIPDYVQHTAHGMTQQEELTYKLSSAIIYPGLLPSMYLAEELHQLLQKDQHILARYGPVQGDLEVRQAIVHYLHRYGQLHTSDAQMIITSGVQQGIDLIARTFIGPGDVVVLEGPTYAAAIDSFRNRGAHIITVPIDEDGFDVQALATLCLTKNVKLVYTIPTFHNPTGIVMSSVRRLELVELAQKHHFLLVEDDSWNDIYFEDGLPPVPLKALDTTGHVLYLKGFSKALAPSCRIGVIIVDGILRTRLLTSKASADLGSPLLTQKALLPFLQAARMHDHLQKLRIALEIRRDTVVTLLTQHAPKSVHWHVPKGGLNIWITLPEQAKATDLLHVAKQQAVTFLPGAACDPQRQADNCLRISFSYLDDASLVHGIERLCACMHTYLQCIARETNEKGSSV